MITSEISIPPPSLELSFYDCPRSQFKLIIRIIAYKCRNYANRVTYRVTFGHNTVIVIQDAIRTFEHDLIIHRKFN